MRTSSLSFVTVGLLFLVAMGMGASATLACSSRAPEGWSIPPAASGADADALGVDLQGQPAGDDDDGPEDDASLPVDDPPLPPVEAGADPLDAAPAPPDEASACTGPLAPGDLAIVEILIASTAGSGDHGEWLEVQSAASCPMDLRGLHGEATVGARVISFDVADDLWLPPSGTFVVADSSEAAVNHRLPGLVIAWAGDPGDVLRNQGATVTLLAHGVLVDSVTYPALSPSIGATLAFPADCPRDARASWPRWQRSVYQWFPGFYGTPNAPNADVHCPRDADAGG